MKDHLNRLIQVRYSKDVPPNTLVVNISTNMVLPVNPMVNIDTKINISTIGRLRINIEVSNRLSQETASDEMIKSHVTSYPGRENWH